MHANNELGIMNYGRLQERNRETNFISCHPEEETRNECSYSSGSFNLYQEILKLVQDDRTKRIVEWGEQALFFIPNSLFASLGACK